MEIKKYFSRKTGKRKTAAMLRGYSVTATMLAIISIFVVSTRDPNAITLCLMTFFFLLIFGAYSLLSLRLRAIEEEREEKNNFSEHIHIKKR